MDRYQNISRIEESAVFLSFGKLAAETSQVLLVSDSPLPPPQKKKDASIKTLLHMRPYLDPQTQPLQA